MNLNQKCLRELNQYLPPGCIQKDDHVPIEGKGCWYTDADGRSYLDFSSGIFTNSIGHSCERLSLAGYRQASQLANVHGRHTRSELNFYQRLFPHLPVDDYKAISYNDGGYAIDRGLTDIIQYFQKQRIGIGAFRGGFHGKTQAAKLLINESNQATFYHNFQIDFPNCYRCPYGMKKGACCLECVKGTCKTLKEHNAQALVFELIQGAGIIVPPVGYWEEIERYCKKHYILLFADEVLTGGGRTGSYLACTQYRMVPDVLLLTKGLANGKPLSVLLEREFITKNSYAMRSMERSSTFASHPESLAVAAELLQMLEEEHILEKVRHLETIWKQGLLTLSQRFKTIGETRCIGLMAAVEFVNDTTSKTPYTEMGMSVFHRCRKNGLETIASGHILRLAPPLCIQEEELKEGLKRLEKSIQEVEYLQ